MVKMVPRMYTSLQIHQIGYNKYIQFFECQSYLNKMLFKKYDLYTYLKQTKMSFIKNGEQVLSGMGTSGQGERYKERV
jgi:hypothetical protein